MLHEIPAPEDYLLCLPPIHLQCARVCPMSLWQTALGTLHAQALLSIPGVMALVFLVLLATREVSTDGVAPDMAGAVFAGYANSVSARLAACCWRYRTSRLHGICHSTMG